MPVWGLIVEFIACAGAIWLAGIWLARATYVIAIRYKLGSAFGGVLILGIGTSLPEIAVVVSAALAHHYEVIIGTLIGGVALQTAVISLFDARMKPKRSITSAAASASLQVEAMIVVIVTAAAIVAIKVPLRIGSRFSASSLAIFLLWLGGLWLIYHMGQNATERPSDSLLQPVTKLGDTVAMSSSLEYASKRRLFFILLVSALAILAAGIGLQSSGTQLAGAWGIGTGFFAATFIALSSSLPDISTGISSVAMGDYKLAMSDIFGANAFMPALFVACDIIAGSVVLVHATATDIWFALLGIALTAIYALGLRLRPKKLYFRLGIDSIVVLVLYLAGTIVLSFVH